MSNRIKNYIMSLMKDPDFRRDVLWAIKQNVIEDDEIRQELLALVKHAMQNVAVKEVAKKMFQCVKESIDKQGE